MWSSFADQDDDNKAASPTASFHHHHSEMPAIAGIGASALFSLSLVAAAIIIITQRQRVAEKFSRDAVNQRFSPFRKALTNQA
jgi:hypothetical protein